MPYFNVEVQINILPNPIVENVEVIFSQMPTDQQVIDEICEMDGGEYYKEHKLAIQINSCTKIIKR